MFSHYLTLCILLHSIQFSVTSALPASNSLPFGSSLAATQDPSLLHEGGQESDRTLKHDANVDSDEYTAVGKGKGRARARCGRH